MEIKARSPYKYSIPTYEHGNSHIAGLHDAHLVHVLNAIVYGLFYYSELVDPVRGETPSAFPGVRFFFYEPRSASISILAPKLRTLTETDQIKIMRYFHPASTGIPNTEVEKMFRPLCLSYAWNNVEQTARASSERKMPTGHSDENLSENSRNSGSHV